MSSEAPPSFPQRMLGLLEPAQFMAWAMSHYVRVCIEAVFKNGKPFAPITQVRWLRDEAFGRFWVEFSSPQQISSDPDNQEVPEPVGSAVLIQPLLRTASGVVLDVGPGTGTQVPFLTSPSISALYGAEPCKGLHGELRAKATAEGVSEKYYILPAGAAASELIPALKATETGVVDDYERDSSQGVFDTILCVRVLCSVPEMERTIGELYELLRPGGRLLVTEHVVNPWRTAKGSSVARFAQAVYQLLGWSFLIGDCALDRDTEGALRRAADRDGGWESIELERSFGWSAMPYISGTLVKKSL